MPPIHRNNEAVAAAYMQMLPKPRAEAAAAINKIRGEVRARFITVIPGQDMVYMEKERAARAWMAEFMTTGQEPNLADYPAIEGEVGLTGDDAYQVAYIYIHMSEAWRRISPVIERISIKYLNLAERGMDIEAIKRLPAAYMAEMEATLAAVMERLAGSGAP